MISPSARCQVKGMGAVLPQPLASTMTEMTNWPRIMVASPAATPVRCKEKDTPVMIIIPSAPARISILSAEGGTCKELLPCMKKSRMISAPAMVPPKAFIIKPVRILPIMAPIRLASVDCVPMAIPVPTALSTPMIIILFKESLLRVLLVFFNVGMRV